MYTPVKNKSTINLIAKLFTADKWNIGYVWQTPESLISNKGLLSKISWLKEDRSDYSADPFAIKIGNDVYIYYEELNFWEGKGKIRVIKNFDFKNKEKVSGILPEGIHLSYPYIFREASDFYCIPETSEALEVALYKLKPEGCTQLQKKRVLLDGAAYVDSSLIFYKDKYWIFTSISQKKNELYIFYADTLDGEFTGHVSNPIAVESKECRGAGNLFIVDGELYRPSQNSSRRYGGSIMINKITRLTENAFSQKTEFELSPEAPYNMGLHTISFVNDRIFLDGKRKVYSAIMPLKKMVRRIRS
ncbi:MAG: hypothetical protein P0Y49_09050 [Candidatus Pedobacter colombiensis]|uniref:Glucosamine inositolphosphorylceramide transferase 1 N-terminal domain-containing protein n=1 Tax=Candidatus Pedobacter colombiensis TaxID=3121371 RepID=A0AAJ6BAI3_9SPHI|nr:hypothetical protein [Pedobacter sp.]WEK21288.1 MAG: hypothetical protein P0Y49_09050 [Pedobacter sp.]